MMYITNTNIKFDNQRLSDEIISVVNDFPNINQINIRKPPHISDSLAITHGVGSLHIHNPKTNKDELVYDEYQWTHYITRFNNTYIQQIIEQIVPLAALNNQVITRARILTLNPKTCLSYHTDIKKQIRYHIPVYTNNNCMFIINDMVERMSEIGTLYTLDSTKIHTAINASQTQKRIHIVINANIAPVLHPPSDIA